ncbi:uncharacterized protein [Macrobrachium rosenbergii]|uniref:uncharacterized protein n=1 Tax=Macrobrachium rosenbergii TaxID=79674 RepID=UPI0034D3BA35
MERLVLTFLLGVSLSAAADATISFVRRTSPGDSVRFALPEGETCILAMKSTEDPSFSYKYYLEGEEMTSNACDKCFNGSLWVPYLVITEKGIRHVHSGSTVFPENLGSSQARNLSIESKGREPFELQTFALPLKEHDLEEMHRGTSVNISLPEKEEMWLALWNDQETNDSVTFNLYYDTEPTHGSFKATVEKGWFIIRISVNKIVYEAEAHVLSKHGLKGRRLELYSDTFLKYQLFSMPLDPKDKKEQTNTNGTLILNVVVASSVLLLLILVAAFLGYRFCWKKKGEELREGSPRVTAAGAGGLTRQNSSHDSENSLYGAGIVTHGDVTRQNSVHDSENSLYGATVP